MLSTDLALLFSGVSLLTSITLFTYASRKIKSIESRVSHIEDSQQPISVVIPQQPHYMPYRYPPVSPTAPPTQVSI